MARQTLGMAYDSFRHRVVLFGGCTDSGPVGDTWEWDGRSWTRMRPKRSPSARYWHRMVYDSARKRIVMFAGDDGKYVNDTWEYDGKTWFEMKPKEMPSIRHAHTMVYDTARQRTVLYGGAGFKIPILDDTWEWDGKNWTRMKPMTSPPPISVAGMIYDTVRQRVVLFGGLTYGARFLNDTWEYDGKTWTKVKTIAAPPARGFLTMSYDQARQRTVMFGGGHLKNVVLSDTWEFNGRTWEEVKTSFAPVARNRHTMVYDAARQRTLLFGGMGLGNPRELGDTSLFGPETLSAAPAKISIAASGTQGFTLNAGPHQADRFYWVLGSVTGTSPGVTLPSPVGSVTVPLNPDLYTDLTIALANTPLLTLTRGPFNASGKALAFLRVPKTTNTAAIGVKLYHAYLVYDAKNNFYMASNPVELTLVK